MRGLITLTSLRRVTTGGERHVERRVVRYSSCKMGVASQAGEIPAPRSFYTLGSLNRQTRSPILARKSAVIDRVTSNKIKPEKPDKEVQYLHSPPFRS